MQWFDKRDVLSHAGALDSGPGPNWGGDMTGLDVAILSAVDRAIGDTPQPLAVRIATEHGAKLHMRNAYCWVVLDQRDTPLWTATFRSKAEAARAFCAQYGISLPLTDR